MSLAYLFSKIIQFSDFNDFLTELVIIMMNNDGIGENH